MKVIRQGDVLLVKIDKLPAGAKPMEPENGRRFVLAHGEVTGHTHAIYEYEEAISAADLAEDAINKAKKVRYAQMYEANGEWYLVVADGKSVQMKHEEHTAATIPAGVYFCPVQVQANSQNMIRKVAD